MPLSNLGYGLECEDRRAGDVISTGRRIVTGGELIEENESSENDEF